MADETSPASEARRSRKIARAFAMIQGGGLGRFLSALVPTAGALAVQFVAFAVTARGLGAVAFGQYAAVQGVAAILVELVGLGGADLLVRAVSRNRERFDRYFGNMLLLIGLTIVPVVLLGYVVVRYQLDLGVLPVYIAMGLAGETLIARVAASAELAMVAQGHIFRASLIRFSVPVVRLVLAVVYFAFSRSLTGWIEAVFVQSLVLSVVLVVVDAWLYGRPRFTLLTGEWRAGVAFSLNQSARAAQGNLDRVVLARFADGAALGAYVAGARVLQLGLFPLQVLTRILYPQFFKHGEQGLLATRRFAIRNVPVMLATSIAAAGAVACAGMVAPAVLGADFAASRNAAMLLSLSIPLIAMQYLAADALTGAGLQHIRAVIYGIAAILFGVGLAIGARMGGVHGLIAAYLSLHATLAAVLWGTAFGKRSAAASVRQMSAVA